jgi:hypothetical protein
MYYRCYATVSRGNIRCLITAGKHANNTRVIARQLLGKQVSAATDTQSTMLKQRFLLGLLAVNLGPNKKLNSVAVVRKRTIPTERSPLVGEVSANLCW